VVDIGGYTSVRSPDGPILVRMTRVPCSLGLDPRSQFRAGRAELLAAGFETFESSIRDQLQRILAPGGFDPAADIMGVTVNRRPHGYAYEYNSLFDPDWDEPDQPHVVGRAPFGRIVIANSDSGAGAYTDVTIDQPWRAVGEALAIAGLKLRRATGVHHARQVLAKIGDLVFQLSRHQGVLACVWDRHSG
jgi:spermidine dehydrogenase